MNAYPLGRKVWHDERSRNFVAAMATDLRPVTHRRYGPVLKQEIGACTGFAAAGALNSSPLRLNARDLWDAQDSVRWYSRATELDPFDGVYPPVDTGSSGLAVAKALLEEKVIAGYLHAFGLDQVLAALVLGPVLVGTDWTQNMFAVDAKGYLGRDGASAGGHQYLLRALDPKRSRVGILNSWGREWGNHGRAWMSFEHLGELLAMRGDAMTLVLS